MVSNPLTTRLRPARFVALLAVLALALLSARLPAQGPVTAEDAEYAQVAHLIDEAIFKSMTPEARGALVVLATTTSSDYPIDAPLCFHPDTDPKVVEAFDTAMADNWSPRYQHAPFVHWSTTATNGGGVGAQGTPVTLTYSFVPDGTTIPTALGFPSGPSVMFAQFNALYGSTAAWQQQFHESFQRWGELNGNTYVWEPNDDGTPTSGSAGALGVRGDIRIGMKTLDGNSGTLAYNFGPNDGDMTFDTGDATAANFGDPLFLQNVIMHEHGHGHGLAHVCPVSQTKLMEPFISLAYHSSRHDDIRSTQRHYGDALENNDTQGTATAMGTRIFLLNFEGDTIGALPAGFTQVAGTNLSGGSASGGENWQVGTTATSTSANTNFNGTTFTANTTQFAYINDDREAAQNAGEDLALRSATFNTTGFTSLRLNFNYDHALAFPGGSTWLAEIYARNGGAWTKVYNLLGDSLGWQNASIDLTPFIGAATQFAFRYNDGGTWAEGLAIDNLELAGNGRGYKIENVSIDDNSDIDWHTFSPATNVTLDLVMAPTGLTYADNPQCTTGNNTNSLTIHNLNVEVRNSTVVLASGNTQPAGTAETITGLALTAAGGPYFIRVFPATTTNDIQTYTLNVTTTPTATPPTVMMNSGTGDPTNASPIPVTVTFSESVTGFVAADITPGNATVQNFMGSGANYSFNLAPIAQGLVTANIAAGIATGQTSGLGNTAAAQFSRTFDSVGPTPVISSVTGNPTNANPIACTVAFVESVTGFVAADITPGNATVQNFMGSGANYSFDLVPIAQGAVTAQINAGVAADAATNANLASSVLSRTFDSVGPTPVISSVTSNPTNANPIACTVTFVESVTGFVAADITPGNATVQNFMGSGANYSFNLVPIAQGAVTAQINAGVAADAATNANLASAVFSRTFDSVGPTPVISSVTSNPTNANPIACTVAFVESVTGFVAADITPGNATVQNFMGSGANYSFDLVPIAQGAVTAQINAGVAADAATNANLASAVFSRTFDSIGPTPVISSVTGNPTNANPIACTVAFVESVTGFVAADITPGNATVQNFMGSGANYSFDLVPIAQGAVTAQINAGVAADAATNANLASAVFSRTFDSVGPTPVISSVTGNPTNANPIACTVAFVESVTGFVAADITPGNATVQNFMGSGANYSFDLVPIAQGAVTAQINAGVAADAATNANLASAVFSRTFDSVGPTPVISSVTGNPTNANPIACTVAFVESVTGFVAADITPGNATVQNFMGSGANYSFDLVPIAQGAVTAQINAGVAADAATNANLASAVLSRTFDSVAPMIVSITPSTVGPTNASSITFTVTFFESVTGFDSAADLVINHTGTANAGATVMGGPLIYTVDVTGLSGDGTFTLAISTSGGIADLATNALAASPTSAAVAIDRVNPTVVSISPQSEVIIDLTYSESVNGAATTASNYTISGAGQGTVAANPSTAVLQGGTTYRLTWGAGAMINGQPVTVTVTSAVEDSVTNPILLGMGDSASSVAVPVELSALALE